MSDRASTQRTLTDRASSEAKTGSARAGAGTAPSGGRRVRRDIDLDVLTQHLGYFLRRAQVSIFQDFIKTLAAVDLRPAQYSVLVVIGANAGLSQAELADRLGIERARLVHMLDHLQQRRLMERLPSPTDRRTHALQLTPEGHKVLKRAKALAARHEARLADKIGPDARDEMLRLLKDIEDR